MPKLKTKKTFQKRFTITNKGKVIKRANRQSHYNARASGEATLRKRRDIVLRPGHAKVIKQLMAS